MSLPAATATATTLSIRPALAADAASLLALMRELAVFEGYIDEFCVNENDLLERSLHTACPQFMAYVAASPSGELLGYAVVVEIAFTFDLRPDWRLKELYVRATARQSGVGRALMQFVIAEAIMNNCGRLKWDVLPGNQNARRFYSLLGGEPVQDWEAWVLQL